MKHVMQEEDEKKQKTLLQKAGELIGDILDNDMEVSETETSYEMNLAMVKIKHTVKRTKKQKPE
jgi:hypothetical protein